MHATPSIMPLTMMSVAPLLLVCLVALACRPRRRWKHRKGQEPRWPSAACDANTTMFRRRRRGGWGWWWIPLVLFIVWMSGRLSFREKSQWAYDQAKQAALVAREAAERSLLPPAYVTADGRPAAVIEVRVSPSRCKNEKVTPADLAAGTLSVIDSLPIKIDDNRDVRRRLQELENTVVHTNDDGDTVEFDDVARLTVRQPDGTRNAPIGAIHLKVDEKSPRGRKAGEILLKDVEHELASVHDARVKADKASFALAGDNRLLIIELAGAHRKTLTELLGDSEIAGSIIEIDFKRGVLAGDNISPVGIAWVGLSWIENFRTNPSGFSLNEAKQTVLPTQKGGQYTITDIANVRQIGSPGQQQAPPAGVRLTTSAITPAAIGFFDGIENELKKFQADSGSREAPPVFFVRNRLTTITLTLAKQPVPTPSTPLVASTTSNPAQVKHRLDTATEKTARATFEDRGLIEEIVEIATGAALGEDESVSRAIWRAKMRAAKKAKDAVAQAATKFTGAEPVAESVPPVPPTAPYTEYNVDSAVARATHSQKPTWIDLYPTQVDHNGVYTLIGSTGAFYSTPQEAEDASSQTRDEMTASFINLVLGPGASAKVPVGDVRKLPTDKWTGPVAHESGLPYYETHILMRFDEHDQRNVLRAWTRRQSQRQVWFAGIAGGTVLFLLATVLAYLKFDTATRGYYSGRLKLLAVGLALAVVAPVSLLVVRLASSQGPSPIGEPLHRVSATPLALHGDWSGLAVMLASGVAILFAFLLVGMIFKRNGSPQTR